MEARAQSSSVRVDASGAQPRRVEGSDDFSRQVTLAENINLRERLGRLEASIAFWAADLDEANDEAARLRQELEGMKRLVREAEDRRATAEDARATLIEEVALRDDHIADLEARLHEHDLTAIDGHRVRARLEALRSRMRARIVAQAEEIAGLRRTLALGHAARVQVEAELRQCHLDAKRNARYLDKLEERLRTTGR